MKHFANNNCIYNSLFGPLLLILGMTGLSGIAHAQVLDWAVSVGGKAVDDNRSLAVDHHGNIYLAGTFSDTADFNPGSATDVLVPAGRADAFLAKYDPESNYQWAIRMGGSAFDYGKGVAVDAQGNVYVVGYFVMKANFNPAGGDTLHAGMGMQDIFVAKYDRDGNYLWAINMGGTKVNYGMGIAVSPAGNVYVTGYFSGTTDFDPGPDTARLTAAPGGFFGGDHDAFMAKYDSLGNYIWAYQLGGSGADDVGHGIAVDDQENVYLTGYFGSSSGDFNPDPLVSDYLMRVGSSGFANDAFIAKYDADGGYLWAQSLGSKADDNGLGVAVDQAYNVYFTGYFSDTAIFDPWGTAVDTLIAHGEFSYDAFVAKYDSSGHYVWSNNIGGAAGDELGHGIAIDRAGNVFVSGYFTDSADVGTVDPLRAAAGSQDAFMVKYNPDGQYMWAGSVGGDQYDYGYGVACDGSGNTYVTGNYSGTADLDPGTQAADFTSAGSGDVFLLKLICEDTSSSQEAVSTCHESYLWYDSAYTVSGTYLHIVPNAAGCDSVLILNLTFVEPVRPVITTNAFILGVQGTYATYQWIKDDLPVPGATGDTYQVIANGKYRVAVTNEDGCADTSEVYEVKNYTDIGRSGDWAKQVLIYPNPATDILHVESPVAVRIVLTDIAGRVVRSPGSANYVSLKRLADGLYLLKVYDLQGKALAVEKIIKQGK